MNIWGLLLLCCGLAFLTCTLFGFHHFCFAQFPSQLCFGEFLCIVFAFCFLLFGKPPAYECSIAAF